MNEAQFYRQEIPAIATDLSRPLWSVMIPNYNSAEYLQETLASVLAQAMEPELMQIEVIDDCSTEDDPEAVVQEIGQGRVVFYRQPQNVGYIQNFQTCLLRSRGYLVHILHSDDYVREGFYNKLQALFDKYPKIGAAYCRHIFMNQAGHWMRLSALEQSHSGLLDDSLEKIITRHPIQTPAIVVRRSVYEAIGGFDQRFTCNGEDWEMWVRIASQFAIAYEAEPLALYRCRTNSLSGNALREAQDMRDIQKALAIIQSQQYPQISATMWHKTKEFWVYCGLHHAIEMLAINDVKGAINQIRESLKIYPTLKVLAVYLFYLLPAIAKFLLRPKDSYSVDIAKSQRENNDSQPLSIR